MWPTHYGMNSSASSGCCSSNVRMLQQSSALIASQIHIAQTCGKGEYAPDPALDLMCFLQAWTLCPLQVKSGERWVLQGDLIMSSGSGPPY